MKKTKKARSIYVWATPSDLRKMGKKGAASVGPEKWFTTDLKYRLTLVG